MPIDATAFLKNPEKPPIGSVIVLFGAERFLQQAALKAVVLRVLGREDDEMSLTRLDGKDADLQTVLDELRTVSMFGDGRVVVVDAADDFVTKHRPALEKYLDKPAKKSVLVLMVKKWPKTTKLYKAVEKAGLNVSCEPPKESELPAWLGGLAESRYGKKLPRPAAVLLLELAGTGLGQLDMELAKLAAYVGERAQIAQEDVTQLVGGWRAETTWALVDNLMEGRTGEALVCLDKLLAAREAPLMILGGLTFKFRQLAEATEHSRRGVPLGAALQQAGVWRNKVGVSEQYLRRLGRGRAEQIMTWLLETRDRLGGGGGSLGPSQQRIELERLLVRLAG
jgi:DNA polymerase-3 subunit delta